jgi:hypothetical protein
VWVKLNPSQRRQRRNQKSDEVSNMGCSKGTTGVKVANKSIKKKK